VFIVIWYNIDDEKPKAEDKEPKLLADIVEIMEPNSQSESRLRTTLLYKNMTAKAVYKALLLKGWSEETLPTLQTISNILNRHGYLLRTMENTKVQKNRDGRHRCAIKIPLRHIIINSHVSFFRLHQIS